MTEPTTETAATAAPPAGADLAAGGPPDVPRDEAAPPAVPGPVTPGQRAYEAYGDHAGWTTHDGRVMSLWAQLETAVREHWDAAASAVHRDVAQRLAEGIASVRALATSPGQELPTPAGSTSDPAEAVTAWLAHLRGEAERGLAAVESWIRPAADAALAGAGKAVENVVHSL